MEVPRADWVHTRAVWRPQYRHASSADAQPLHPPCLAAQTFLYTDYAVPTWWPWRRLELDGSRYDPYALPCQLLRHVVSVFTWTKMGLLAFDMLVSAI
jgi:hypothetical protein